MIPFNSRFHGYNSLSYIYRKGDSVHSKLFTVKFIKNPRRNHMRISVVVSKKIFKSAVKRNRIRRRVYEYLRLSLDEFNDNYDLVILVNSEELLNMPYQELISDLYQLLHRAKLLNK